MFFKNWKKHLHSYYYLIAICGVCAVCLSFSLYVLFFFDLSKTWKLIASGVTLLTGWGFSFWILRHRMARFFGQAGKKISTAQWIAILACGLSILFLLTQINRIYMSHTFELVALSNQPNHATTGKVILLEIRDENGEVIPFERLGPPRGWKAQDVGGLKTLVSSGESSSPLRYQFYGNNKDKIKVLFRTSSTAASVQIRMDQDVQVLDLYDSSEGDTALTVEVNYSFGEKLVLWLVYWAAFMLLLTCAWGGWVEVDLRTGFAASRTVKRLREFAKNSLAGKYQSRLKTPSDFRPGPGFWILLALLAAATLAALLLLIHFERVVFSPLVSDEFSYMYNYEYPQKVSHISYFGYLLPALFFWSRPSLLVYRISALIVNLLLAVLFMFSAIRWAEKKANSHIGRPQLLLFAIVGIVSGLSKYAFAMRLTPGYNDIANWAALLAGICILRALTIETGWRPWCLLFLAGLGVGFAFFAKQPNSIALAAGVGVVLVVTFAGERRGFWQGLKLLAAFTLGISAAILIFFTFAVSYTDWIERIRGVLAINPATNSLATIRSEIQNILELYLVSFYPLIVLAALASGIHNLYSKIKGLKWIALGAMMIPAVLPVLLLASDLFIEPRTSFLFLQQTAHWLGVYVNDAYFTPFTTLYSHGALTLLVMGLILGAILLGRAVRSDTNTNLKHLLRDIWQKREIWLVSGLLLLIPLATSAGSSSPLFYLALQSAWAWLALGATILILTRTNTSLTGNWLFLLQPSIIILLLVFFNIAQINIYHGSNETFSSHIEGLHDSAGLLFPEAEATFLSDTKQMLDQSGFKPGDVTFTYAPLYISYFMGAAPPAGHTHWHPYFFSIGLDQCPLISLSKTDLQQGAYIFEGYGGMPKEMTNCLAKMGINFPQDYQKLGSLTEPYTGDIINFYAPRK